MLTFPLSTYSYLSLLHFTNTPRRVSWAFGVPEIEQMLVYVFGLLSLLQFMHASRRISQAFKISRHRAMLFDAFELYPTLMNTLFNTNEPFPQRSIIMNLSFSTILSNDKPNGYVEQSHSK